jgi:DNA transposition AAA+ family ATPase
VNKIDSSPEHVIQVATEFLNSSGMSPVDFARRVGYANNTMQQFMSGRYAAITRADRICAAILEYVSKASGNPDVFTGNLYETRTVAAMRGIFASMLERRKMCLLFGVPGLGKSDIARALIDQHNEQRNGRNCFIFRVNCRKKIRPRDLLKRICTSCGTQSDTGIDRAIGNLRVDFTGARVLLYFDEAQYLDEDCVDTVRELYDEAPRFSLCFAGADDLEKKFAKFTDPERIESRIADKFTLPSITAEEAATILRGELPELELDAASIHQQIEFATTAIRSKGRTQRYISVRRLMDSIIEVRSALASRPDESPKVQAIS